MSTPNRPKPQDDLNAVLELIRQIAEKSADGDYIYRGEPEYFEEVSSGLLRQFKREIGDDIYDTEVFDIEVAQTEILDVAKNYARRVKTGFEMMAQLQHYGGSTNLIDFTTDYLRAFFFACDGAPDADGRVILLQQTEDIKEEYQIEEPRNPQNRVIAQKSVFVRPPRALLNPNNTR